MQITGIEALTKQKYRVELDGWLSFVIYKGELSCYQIGKGQEFSEEQYQRLVKEVLEKRAKLRALHLLTARDRTEAELRQKLCGDGHPAEVVDCAVEYVKGYHYLDDKRYACAYAASCQGKKSKNRIVWELSQKGISGEDMKAAFAECEQDETGIITEIIKKRWHSGENEEKQKRRLYAYLARRGYGISDIKKAFEQALL